MYSNNSGGDWNPTCDPIKPWTPKALLKRCFWGSDTCSAGVWNSREYVRYITLLNLNRLSNAETSYPWNVFSRSKFQGCASDPFLWISRCLRCSNLPGCTFRLAQKVLEKKKSEDRTWNPKSFNSYFFFWLVYVYIYIMFKKVSIYIYTYIYICTVCPTLLGCYALSTCDSIPAGKKSKQKKSKVHLPTFIPLHYTNKQLRHT